ncbi:MAG TPA: sugar ABC transporter permease [Solirubrobacterales bacterium]|nr:sugar ABC transporter permease [Solirubrobacterales bacterium]
MNAVGQVPAAAEPPAPAAAGHPRPNVIKRVLQGDLASVRVVLVLGAIWLVFQSQNDRFLSATNLTNLMLQITGVGLISIGVVYVLLLGEIDLSVGAVSGLAAAVMAVMNVKHGWNPYLAIGAGVLTGLVIGVVQGALATAFGIPSFVVTLAGLLAWQGALLYVLGDTGTVNLNDPTITGLANTFYSDSVGWVIAVAVVAGYAALALWGYRHRVAAQLTDQRLAPIVVRIAVVAVAVFATVAILNSDRGVPLALLILIAFLTVMEFIAVRTTFGRKVYAVGGNIEAARRAGINTSAVRIAVFGIAGTMSAVGGIFLASRLLAVNQSSGGSDLLLLAIAGPVIAGTSLFGGRGSVWSALLGALVIGSISNGMDLLALESSVKYMVTGAVLLVAVIIDAIARRQRQATGRV